MPNYFKEQERSYSLLLLQTTQSRYQTHGSVSAAKKNKKTGKNRAQHTSVLFTRTMI